MDDLLINIDDRTNGSLRQHEALFDLGAVPPL